MITGTKFEMQSEPWTPWNVYWSAIWVGALAALVAALIFGLVGTAVGATTVEKFSSWKTITLINLAFVVFATFFAFAIGGWCAGKITGALHSERTILHASIAWLVATPMLLVLIAAGAGNAFGGWYGGLIAAPAAGVIVVPAPDIVRGTALSAVTAILIGLVGSVIGGWISSGEPMTFTHYRTRTGALKSQKAGH